MPTERPGDETDRPFCDARPQSEVLIAVDSETGEEETEVIDEGYDCPNFAVGRYEIETHYGSSMEFDACEEHAEDWHEDGIVVEEVDSYV